MSDSPRAMMASAVMAAILVILVPSRPASASGEPQESVLYQNFLRAMDVLDRAAVAHGGPGLLDRSANVRITFKGLLRYEGHYPRPWAQKEYPFDGSTLYSAELKAVKTEQTFPDKDKPTTAFAILGPSNGYERAVGASKPDSIPTADLEKRIEEELEQLPHEYLRQARAAAASLRSLPGHEGHDVIAYTHGSESRALFLDATTHLLMRVERIDHWKHKGDRLEWRTFGGYTDRSGVRIPIHSEAHVENGSTQQDLITEIVSVEVGGTVNADDFTIPTAYRAGLETWALARSVPENPDEPLPYHDLGKGAYIIDLPPSDARSLLVAFADFSVIVEAGDYSEISRRILATARKLLPDKPVRYVAMTHHHPLYANGLRPYAQQGITILATPGNVSYYRELTTRPYRIHPDQQQRNPREPKIEVIDKVRIIKDKKQRLELHMFDYSTHTDEYVLPYLPSHKLIVTGDMVYILRTDKPRPANVRELAIHRVVTEKELEVQSIMQTWFLEDADSLVPYAALEEHVRTPKPQASSK
jgi:glyoxylase-like metal-dependent hydrolase (beta-lactamase superfamily II)